WVGEPPQPRPSTREAAPDPPAARVGERREKGGWGRSCPRERSRSRSGSRPFPRIRARLLKAGHGIGAREMTGTGTGRGPTLALAPAPALAQGNEPGSPTSAKEEANATNPIERRPHADRAARR